MVYYVQMCRGNYGHLPCAIAVLGSGDHSERTVLQWQRQSNGLRRGGRQGLAALSTSPMLQRLDAIRNDDAAADITCYVERLKNSAVEYQA